MKIVVAKLVVAIVYEYMLGERTRNNRQSSEITHIYIDLFVLLDKRVATKRKALVRFLQQINRKKSVIPLNTKQITFFI